MESDRPATSGLHNKEPGVNVQIGANAYRCNQLTMRHQTASVAVVTETPPRSAVQVKFLQGPGQVAVLVAWMAELDQSEQRRSPLKSASNAEDVPMSVATHGASS